MGRIGCKRNSSDTVQLLPVLWKVGEMGMNDKPNKVTTVLKVVVTGEFYDDDATEETLRYSVEQDLEDAGFDVDITVLKEQEAVKPTWSRGKPFCGACGLRIRGGKFCSECGKPIAWEGR